MNRNLAGSARGYLATACLIVAPAMLAGLELFHPGGFTDHPGMYEALSHPADGSAGLQWLAYFGPGWWFALHMIQAPLLGFVVIGLWLLADEAGPPDGRVALVWLWLARAALFVFAIDYTTLDAIDGIGLGRTMQIVQRLQAEGSLTPAQVEGIRLVLDQFWTDPWVGGVRSVLSETGGWTALVTAVASAARLFRWQASGWVTVIALVAFGWELHVSHANPHGPVAFACLILASAALWWRQRRQ